MTQREAGSLESPAAKWSRWVQSCWCFSPFRHKLQWNHWRVSFYWTWSGREGGGGYLNRNICWCDTSHWGLVTLLRTKNIKNQKLVSCWIRLGKSIGNKLENFSGWRPTCLAKGLDAALPPQHHDWTPKPQAAGPLMQQQQPAFNMNEGEKICVILYYTFISI